MKKIRIDKTATLVFLLILFVVSFLAFVASAGVETGSWGPFECVRQGGSKTCSDGGNYFDKSHTYVSAVVKARALSQRYSGSSIKSNVCLIPSSGNGTCQWYNCSDQQCGDEIGNPGPWYELGGPDKLEKDNPSGVDYEVTFYAEVDDAAVRLFAEDGEATYYDPVICSPGNQTVNVGETARFDASDGDGSNYDWWAPGSSNERDTGRNFSTTYSTPGSKTVRVDSSTVGEYDTCNVNVELNGVCSVSHYDCDAGTSANNVSSATEWTWKCNGSNGGSNATCSEPVPSVNQNFVVKSSCASNPAISGATVSISRGCAGTSRTTDGGGFANFCAYQGDTINASVSKSGYQSLNINNINVGNGGTENVRLTPTAGCLPPEADIVCNNSGGSCSIPYNSAATIEWCGSNGHSCSDATSCSVSGTSWSGTSNSKSTGNLTSSRDYTLTCNGPNGSRSDTVTVNVGAAPVPGCTDPSASNYNPSATVDNGSCIFTCPLPSSQTRSCTSSPNACSQTSTGTQTQTRTCNTSTGNNSSWSDWSSCSATTPANPAGYGNACTSSANVCGQTSSGTIQCNGSCSATTPANTCSSTVDVSASPNPVVYNTSSTLTWGDSTNMVANSCSITGGVVVGGSTGLPTSGSKSTANLIANTTYTVTCTGFDGSPKNASVTINVGAAPVMNYFRCNGVNTPGTCTIGYGDTAAITWSSSNTTVCSLVSTLPSDDAVSASGSRNDANITANRNYTIECWNGTSGVHAPALSLPLRVVVSGPSVDIKAAPPGSSASNGPITLAWNTSANISWTSSNASSCTKTGDWSGSATPNVPGSQSTGNLTNPKTYNYTLTCSGNGSTSDTVQVILSAPIPSDPANVTVTPPDYCQSGPAATISWTYSDPSGSPQSAYEVEMDEQGSFQDSEYRTGKVLTSSNSNFTGQGVLQFNKTYKTRVRVWNSYDVVSGWTVGSGNFNTPPYAYPQVDFSWIANGILNNPSPPLNKPVDFTDATVFNGNPNGRRWDWTFGDGGTSTAQNPPAHTYVAEGSYYVTLTATDNANQVCVRTKGPLIIQKPIPKWREIAPR